MPTPNRPPSQNKYPEQYMGNTSFDEDFGVNAIEILGHELAGNVLRRIKVDNEGRIETTATFSGSFTGSATFKDNPADSGETAKFGKRNATTLKPQVESVLQNSSGQELATGLNLRIFDYVSRVLTDPITETYTFKTGGSGGTTTNTVVVVYTNITLSTISSVTKT